jgi:hypothetical protein
VIDVANAEVKSGNRNRLNSIWQPGNEGEKVSRVAYSQMLQISLSYCS